MLTFQLSLASVSGNGSSPPPRYAFRYEGPARDYSSRAPLELEKMRTDKIRRDRRLMVQAQAIACMNGSDQSLDGTPLPLFHPHVILPSCNVEGSHEMDARPTDKTTSLACDIEGMSGGAASLHESSSAGEHRGGNDREECTSFEFARVWTWGNLRALKADLSVSPSGSWFLPPPQPEHMKHECQGWRPPCSCLTYM